MKKNLNIMVKVTSVLMIISGAWQIWVAAVELTAGGLTGNALLKISGILRLASAIFSTAAGVFGLTKGSPRKLKICLILGIITLLLSAASSVITFFISGTYNVGALVTGLAIPAAFAYSTFEELQSSKKK